MEYTLSQVPIQRLGILIFIFKEAYCLISEHPEASVKSEKQGEGTKIEDQE